VVILRGHVSARVRCRRGVTSKADSSAINSRRILGCARRSCPVSGCAASPLVVFSTTSGATRACSARERSLLAKRIE
jgi:hypothetical protein